MTDEEIDPAGEVTVSVLHGSFDCAGYALMIGVYSDEEMSGAERFLDRQFGQLLSGWQDLGHYPGQLGTSVFGIASPTGTPSTLSSSREP